jgi:organic hydroperoxide reductase OsmC/OhrA
LGNFAPDTIETHVDSEVVVGFPSGVPGSLRVTVRAAVPGIRQDQFQDMANTALKGCIIGRFFNVEATMEATLLT